MATPQSAPHPPLHPSSASKKNATSTSTSTSAAVHTPAGPASAPRSVPSPAAVRVSGKTPAGGANMNKMSGGTPMGLSLSSLGMSPSGFTPGMAGGTQGGGMGGGGIGGLPGFTPNSSSSATMMMPSMSDLGLSSKRSGDGEFERKRKMRAVLKKIGGRSTGGGVSEEGICRISRRVGLANDVDAEGEEARREREGERGISIAGRDVLIDVDMRGNQAQGVIVAGMGGVSEGEMERAGKVLSGLLVGENADLEGFGRELGRIATLDRVGERGVSAFEAVSGVGGCLERLYMKECEKEDPRTVMKKRSGRPWMHARGRIGLGVHYWTTAPPKDDDAMDLDDQKQEHVEQEDPSGFLTLHLTAETCPAGMYPPVRISSTWLPEDLSSTISSKTDEDGTTTNNSSSTTADDFQPPWQDPPPTYTTPPTEDEEAPPGSTEQHPQGKLPDIRFLAKLDPPLIVPYQVATQILAEMGGGGEGVQGMGMGMGMLREWHLMLAEEVAREESSAATRRKHSAVNADTDGGEIMRSGGLGGSAVVVLGEEGGDGEEVKHVYSVAVTKAEWGYRLTEFPFAHPRQVVGVLPVLRQWGVFGGLVKSLLRKDSGVEVVHGVRGGVGTVRSGGAATGGDDDMLDSLLLLTPPLSEQGGDEPEKEEAVRRITVEICTSPSPTLSFGIPLFEGPSQQQGGGRMKMGKIVIGIERDGVVRCLFVEEFGELEGGEDGDVGEKVIKERIAKAVEICGGEVGVWGEWVRGRGWRRGGGKGGGGKGGGGGGGGKREE